MTFTIVSLVALALAAIQLAHAIPQTSLDHVQPRPSDPCAVIGGKKWVTPADARACFESFPVDPEIKANIIDVVKKTLGFHTSVNYELRAPEPFTADVHEDLLADLARISKQYYPSDFALHIDLSQTLKRLKDGHCTYINDCYDSTYTSYLPTPLVLLTDPHGIQSLYIAPEAFQVASAEFADEIDVWQNALPGHLKGNLASLSGARVLRINGQDPFVAVNAHAQTVGTFQPLSIRQNSFFASYNRGDSGWSYNQGGFASLPLPLTDSATLTIQRVNSTKIETVTLPYLARIAPDAVPWKDSASFRQNNCVAINGTNGIDLNGPDAAALNEENALAYAAVAKYRQGPRISRQVAKKHALNVIMDNTPMTDIALPPALTPANPLNTSTGVSEFHLLEDSKTGVLALGSFQEEDIITFEQTLLTGLTDLKDAGATQLLIDVSNNGGGFLCITALLHRLIAGPKSTTVPQANLLGEARNPPLARLIVQNIIANSSIDPLAQLLYNPVNWMSPNGTEFPADFNWLEPPVNKTINGRHDQFSMRVADFCPFKVSLPDAPLFDTRKVAIVGNGVCASSCALFATTMAKEEGAKTVVVGGKKDVEQRYCGTVGGLATDFSEIDTDIKTANLKDHPDAPPDFKTNSIQGVTWKLDLGVQDPTQPEEWQDHPADFHLPLTMEIVNKPLEIWKQIAEMIF